MPCDASGMAEIHRFFKSAFGEGGGHLDAVSKSLHGHHEFEDGSFWEPLTQRAPGCALHVARMRQQHADMLVHLNALDAALPAWRGSGRVSDAAPVLAALVGINAELAVHLPDEESNVVPVMEEALEQRDMDAASEHGRKITPKGYRFAMLGHILAAQPDGGDEWMRKHMRRPARWIWRGSAGASTRTTGGRWWSRADARPAPPGVHACGPW